MENPQEFQVRGYEWPSPQEPLFGRYIHIDLAARPNLTSTFDAVERVIVQDYWAVESVPFARITWAIVFAGVEPRERERVAEVQQQYLLMWDRYPELWPQLEVRNGVVSVWFIDHARRPFLGCVCEEAPWDMWLSGRDVREERIFRKFLAEGEPPILMALNAVHADELAGLARPQAA